MQSLFASQKPLEKRRLETIKFSEKNSMCYWWRIRNPLRIIVNFIIIELCKYLPSLTVKRVLLRMLGMKVGKNVSIGFGVQFDIFFPELIEIKDNSIIGYNTTLLSHEFLTNKFRKGKIIIGRNVMIGANSTILAGVRIGDNSVISACSFVNRDVPKNRLVRGNPAKVVRA